MKRIRIIGACVIASSTIGAFASATASAAPPEVGRCVPAESTQEGKKTIYHGMYASPHCTRTKPADDGKYEWLPGPGTENKFFGEGEDPVLETVAGATVSCGALVEKGEYTGPKTEKLTASLEICEDAAKRPCQTSPAKEGVISGLATLEGDLAYVNAAKHLSGWDLKPEGSTSKVLFTYYCGKLPEVIHTVEGSVIGEIKNGFFSGDINKMSLHGAVKYKATKGKQLPEAFEGMPADVLTTAASGLETKAAEQTGLTTPVETISGLGESMESEANQEPLEVKTK
jgi:hypothetical protein